MNADMFKKVNYKKGTSRETINQDLKKKGVDLELIDDIYKGKRANHHWKTSEGKSFKMSLYYIQICANHKETVEAGGEYIYIESYFKGNKESIGGKVTLRVKHIYCGEEYLVRLDSFKKYGCSKCCGKYENSLAYYIKEELNLKLEDIVDIEETKKLGLNPYFIFRSSGKTIIMKCNNDDHPSYPVRVSNFTQLNRGCPLCNGGTRKVLESESLEFKLYHIAKTIAFDEDRNEVDTKSICINSHDKFFFRCHECGQLSSKPIRLDTVVNHGYSCEHCSNTISFPERIMMAVLKQLGIVYVIHKTFEWSKNVECTINEDLSGKKIYDFWLPFFNKVIECQGRQHFIDVPGRRPAAIEQQNDNLKRETAINNGILDSDYHIIDFNYRSTPKFSVVVANIKEALGTELDLEDVDWKKAWEEASNSIVVQAWNLRRTGMSAQEIADKLQLHKSTVITYLKHGDKIGKCVYNGRDEMIKAGKTGNHGEQKFKIVFPTTSEYEVVNSKKELCQKLNISHSTYTNNIKSNNNIIDINIFKTKTKNQFTDKIIENLKPYNGCRIELIK